MQPLNPTRKEYKEVLDTLLSTLQRQIFICLFGGFVISFFVPFVFNEVTIINIVINYISHGLVIGLGLYCHNKSSLLERNRKISLSLDKLDRDLLKRQLAIEHQNNLKALNPILVSPQQIETVSPQTIETTQVQEQQTETVSETVPETIPSLVLSSEQDVVQAIHDGVADSDIIKRMGFTGRKYNEGKMILQGIKDEITQGS